MPWNADFDWAKKVLLKLHVFKIAKIEAILALIPQMPFFLIFQSIFSNVCRQKSQKKLARRERLHWTICIANWNFSCLGSNPSQNFHGSLIQTFAPLRTLIPQIPLIFRRSFFKFNGFIVETVAVLRFWIGLKGLMAVKRVSIELLGSICMV